MDNASAIEPAAGSPPSSSSSSWPSTEIGASEAFTSEPSSPPKPRPHSPTPAPEIESSQHIDVEGSQESDATTRPPAGNASAELPGCGNTSTEATGDTPDDLRHAEQRCEWSRTKFAAEVLDQGEVVVEEETPGVSLAGSDADLGVDAAGVLDVSDVGESAGANQTPSRAIAKDTSTPPAVSATRDQLDVKSRDGGPTFVLTRPTANGVNERTPLVPASSPPGSSPTLAKEPSPYVARTSPVQPALKIKTVLSDVEAFSASPVQATASSPRTRAFFETDFSVVRSPPRPGEAVVTELTSDAEVTIVEEVARDEPSSRKCSGNKPSAHPTLHKEESPLQALITELKAGIEVDPAVYYAVRGVLSEYEEQTGRAPARASSVDEPAPQRVVRVRETRRAVDRWEDAWSEPPDRQRRSRVSFDDAEVRTKMRDGPHRPHLGCASGRIGIAQATRDLAARQDLPRSLDPRLKGSAAVHHHKPSATAAFAKNAAGSQHKAAPRSQWSHKQPKSDLGGKTSRPIGEDVLKRGTTSLSPSVPRRHSFDTMLDYKPTRASPSPLESDKRSIAFTMAEIQPQAPHAKRLSHPQRPRPRSAAPTKAERHATMPRPTPRSRPLQAYRNDSISFDFDDFF
ncbi:hypothetical protein JCM8202v2_000793 [Rhodotorula sphaerocarpa]